MSTFELAAALLTLAAALSYVNHRLLRLPTAVGLMALTLALSLVVLAAGQFAPAVRDRAAAVVGQIDLNQALLHGMLGFLLFAGALHINLGDLRAEGLAVAALTTVGVLISTAVVGGLTWWVLALVGVEARLVYCLLFGALISPTDPIAVLSLLKQFGAPRRLEVQIAGESLFNDGVGVVVFLGLLEVATLGGNPDPAHLAGLFLREAVGGALFGLAAGYLVFRLLKPVDNYQVEVLLSLALVAGGYALAGALHLSGPIAMVVAGLLIGNHGRAFAMSPATVEHLDVFWELIDEVLNAVLFVLIGLEVLVLTLTGQFLLAGALAVPVALVARWASVGLPVWALGRRRPFERGTVFALTWGGLRGGISVAMALSLPAVPEREVVLVMTYAVVAFSILVQGLTVGPLLRRRLARPADGPRGA